MGTYNNQERELIRSDIFKTYPSENVSWTLAFSNAILEGVKKKIEGKNSFYDYLISKYCIQYLHPDSLGTLISLNNKTIQGSTTYNFWQKHIYDPISEGLSIRKIIENA